MEQDQILVVIVGPTAVGKTALSIELARHFDTEIISGDSRQFYRELNIGTAKPSKEQLKKVRHHLINSHSINDQYNAGSYARDVHEILEQTFKKKNLVILVGGSGMYINAVYSGFNEIPEVPEGVRMKFNKLLAEKGLDYLSEMLKVNDPEYHKKIDKSNPQRIVRALEVIDFSGKTFSSFQSESIQPNLKFKTIKIGLNIEREDLYLRIDERVDEMIEKGLFEEASRLHKFRNLYALQTVGYNEIFDHLEGKFDKYEAIRLLKRNSRRYAKRQLTWFKREEDINWFKPEETDKVIEYIVESSSS